MYYVAGIIAFFYGCILSYVAYIEAKNIKGGIIKNFRKYFVPVKSEQLAIYIAVGLLFSVFFFSLNFSIYALIIFLVLSILIHATIVDMYTYEISSTPLLISIILLIILNVVSYIFDLNIGDGFLPDSNLIAGALAAIVFFLIINLTNKKGMGEGDLFVFVVMGLALGLPKLIISFYIMIITGSIFGLILGAKEKRIRGIKMPFVPFMTMGFITAIIFGDSIISLFDLL